MDRQSHRLVITRSRLTKPHDSAVSHEPPYMCAEATLIAFVIAQRPHAEDGARFEPLCTACDASTSRIATSLRRPSVAFAATSQQRNFFSFLVCFPFSSFLFASQCVSVLVCLPMSESQRQLSQSKPAAGSRCKSKVQNVRSDAERVVDGENERPALQAFGCARWPCCRQQEQEQRVSAAEVELQQQYKKRKYGVCKLR